MGRVGLGLLATATALLTLPAGAAAQSRHELPVVSIDAPTEIVDEPKRRATMRLINRSGRDEYRGHIGIEFRGFTSQQDDPKKSYALETRRASGENRDVSLLGMPKDDDWVMIASYGDQSLLRNLVAYSAVRWLGWYASRTRLVEVVVNGSYEGVYLFAEELKLHKSRLALDDSDVSGGYLLEMVSTRRTEGEQFFTTPVHGQPIVHQDPKADELSRGRADWIRGYVGLVERRLYGSRFRHPRRGYRRYLDLDAAVDFVLLSELFRNADTFRNSTYMHKGVGGKLVLGPVWDFDHAIGNDGDAEFNLRAGWQYRTRTYRWVEQLYADPAFRRAMAARWRSMRSLGLIRHIMRSIDHGARQLAGAPQERNFSRWPAPPGNHAQAVDYLKWWLAGRAKWIDRHVEGLRP